MSRCWWRPELGSIQRPQPGHDPEGHFGAVTQMVASGSGAQRPVLDIELSRLLTVGRWRYYS